MTVLYCKTCNRIYYKRFRKFICNKCGSECRLLPISFVDFTNMNEEERKEYIINLYRK